MLNLENLTVSPHAWQTIKGRCVDVEDLVEALRSPEVVEPSDGDRRFVRGPLAVVVAGPDDAPIVKTVLLRETGQWDDEDARRRFEGGSR